MKIGAVQKGSILYTACKKHIFGAGSAGVGNVTGDSILDTANSCSSGGGWNYSDDEYAITDSTNYALCGSLGSSEYFFGSTSNADAVLVNLVLEIPDDAVTISVKTTTFTFEANSAG